MTSPEEARAKLDARRLVVAPVADVALPGRVNGAGVADVALVALPRGVDGELAGILDEVDAIYASYVAFPTDEARWAVAAWIVHTWVLDSFESTPRLAVLSPEKGSGKTRVLEVAEPLVPGPLHTVNVTAAALFRKVADGPCTLLLDEADTYLGVKEAKNHEDLRGLVNAGHRRGAVAYRCVVEKGVRVEEFPAFAPVALAGIGDLPDTILDRSVVIAMKRRAPHEQVVPFRHRKAVAQAQPVRDRLEAWAVVAELDDDVDMPDGIVDRAADVWEPLVILGDAAGEPWATRIRDAAVKLNRERSQRDPSLGIMLLADCRTIFTTDDRFTTEELIARLVDLEESPWGDLRGQPIDSRGLARRLRPYGVRPGDHRFPIGTRKGYLRADFHDAWNRYLPPEEGNKGNTGDNEPEAFDTSAYEDAFPEAFDAN